MDFGLQTRCYEVQRYGWPSKGRHIIAAYDENSIVVYQAYSPAIGDFALAHGRFGGEFRCSRMSWIKTNFLWMMYRSKWGTKRGQEVTLGIRLRRQFFETLLAESVPSAFDQVLYVNRETWEREAARSDVSAQWDPDHDPAGKKLERRALQLGLRGETLRQYGGEEIVEIIDMSPFVEKQRPLAKAGEWDRLETPIERVFDPSDPGVARHLGLASGL